MNEPPRYMNVREAATYIARTEEAVRCLVKRAAIPHLKIGRRIQFEREVLDAWMKRHRRAVV